MSGGHGAQGGRNRGYKEWMWGFEDVSQGQRWGRLKAGHVKAGHVKAVMPSQCP